jgi:hypothetical protein
LEENLWFIGNEQSALRRGVLGDDAIGDEEAQGACLTGKDQIVGTDRSSIR